MASRAWLNANEPTPKPLHEMPAVVLNRATTEIAIGSKPCFDATMKPPAKASNGPGHLTSRWMQRRG
jgi:hypothetical protein